MPTAMAMDRGVCDVSPLSSVTVPAEAEERRIVARLFHSCERLHWLRLEQEDIELLWHKSIPPKALV